MTMSRGVNFYMAVVGQSSWGKVCGNYLLPAFIGNVFDGVALVAAINHAQVVSGKGGKISGDHPT